MIPVAKGSSLLAAFIALLLLPLSATAQQQDKLTKKQVSANGVYTIYLRESPDKTCKVIVTKEGNPYWQLQSCLATTNDLFFVSNDGQSFWVLHTLAEKKKGKKKAPWAGSVVAVLYDRAGNRKQTKTAGQLVPKLGYPEVRELGGHVKWLEGVLGTPGKPPRVNDKNQLEFETVGPGYIKLPFAEPKETK